MAPKFLLILFLTTLSSTPISSYTTAQLNTFSTFVNTSCSAATYPSVCRKSLLPYAASVKTSPLRLVNVALSTTLRSATATLSTVSQLAKSQRITKWESAIIKDCIDNLKDSIDELKSSLKAISGVPTSKDKSFLISNVQTWTSSAITDENTCVDELTYRKVSPAIKKKIRSSIVSLARVSSNALYLINHLTV